MKDVIETVLNDESYTTNEEKIEAIAKGLATVVIPKNKYNDINDKLKIAENNLETIKTEYENFKQLKMTDDEKKESELKQLEQDKKINAITKSELAVEKLLLKNGIEIKEDDIELQNTIKSIISEDYDKSINLANGFISLLNKTKEQTAKETTTQLLNGTPRPIGGVDSSATISKVDELKKQLEVAIKNKDVILQTQLTTQIFQEQQRQKK